MKPELEKQHAVLLAASAKFTNKVSPLLVACGLIQEGLNLNQAVVDHANNLKLENDELKKRLSALENAQTIPGSARGSVAGTNSGGASGTGGVGGEEVGSTSRVWSTIGVPGDRTEGSGEAGKGSAPGSGAGHEG
jgi:hypothetical protein